MALPPLMKLLGVMLVGASGLTLLQHPDVAKATQPSDQPAAYGPTQRTAQTPPQSPSTAPSQPQAPSTSEAVVPFLIVPGQSVGPVTLGRPIREELVRFGPAKSMTQLGDGTRMYRWFEPPSNTGIGVRTNQNGTVLIVWVLNDARYATKEGLHVGSTEAEVLSALGAPTRVESDSQAKTPQASSPPPTAASPQTSSPTPDNRLYTVRTRRGFRSLVERLAGDTVQLLFGTFTSQKDAETLSRRIAGAGYDAWVREGTVYLLQLGPYPQSSVGTITGIIKSGVPEATVIAVPVP